MWRRRIASPLKKRATDVGDTPIAEYDLFFLGGCLAPELHCLEIGKELFAQRDIIAKHAGIIDRSG